MLGSGGKIRRDGGEAENAKRELFGFDRTREIRSQSAVAVAAAQGWGQTDDITVVTVRRKMGT